MLERDTVIAAFRTTLEELNVASGARDVTLTKIADYARDVYCRTLEEDSKKPSIWTFRSYLLGARANAEITALVQELAVTKTSRLNPHRLIDSFRKALEWVKEDPRSRRRPRSLAVAAHRFYCETLAQGERKPALVSFTQKVTGKTADPKIVELLREGGVEGGRHATLDRARLREAFSECIRKLEGRILRGVARPLHLADGAHRIYSSQTPEEEPKPSKLTFRRLIYGQNADPEIASLIQPYFHGKK